MGALSTDSYLNPLIFVDLSAGKGVGLVKLKYRIALCLQSQGAGTSSALAVPSCRYTYFFGCERDQVCVHLCIHPAPRLGVSSLAFLASRGVWSYSWSTIVAVF